MNQFFLAQCINTARVANDAHDFDAAVWWCKQALDIAPSLPEAWYNLGIALGRQGKQSEAIDALVRASACAQLSSDAQNSIGFQLIALDADVEAEHCLERAMSLAPNFAFPYVNLGKLRVKQKRLDEAEALLTKALELNPTLAAAYVNLAAVLNEQKRNLAAEAACQKAIDLDPKYWEAWSGLSLILLDLKRNEEAVTSARNAISLNSQSYEAWKRLGVGLWMLKQYEAAADCFTKSSQLNPKADFLAGHALNMRLLTCNWTTLARDQPALVEGIHRGERVTIPFLPLVLTSSLSLQREAAKIYADVYPEANIRGPFAKRRGGDGNKLRIGYFSADFGEHPVSYLMAEIFELHDKSRFELIGFSFGPNTQDLMRKRVEAAFDKFVDVWEKSDLEVARLSRELQVDIAVDLGGYTKDARTGVFALRAAPIQLSYLGYLGTMGAPYYDYLIADKTIVPAEFQKQYSEKILYLPSYQANDSARLISNKIFSREELGLPSGGFVFCCFNNNFKILPDIFDVWMRILRCVEGSVLFLYADNPQAELNLKTEAVQRGVDPDRLIFAGRVERSQYLARLRVADLFLDTFPYNAGTTASDALWAGLPVLTCMGESFASRVAASLLSAIGLPELITSSLADYEALAIELATKPMRLLEIKQKLSRNRATFPLFDSIAFTRNLESAYQAIHERDLRGLGPEHIQIS